MGNVCVCLSTVITCNAHTHARQIGFFVANQHTVVVCVCFFVFFFGGGGGGGSCNIAQVLLKMGDALQ